MNSVSKKLILFDIDGTLTVPRIKITSNMIDTLIKLQKIENIDIGFVGGSDLEKQIEQLGIENIPLFKWRFSENGLMAFYENNLIHKKSIIDELGELKYQNLINIILQVLSEINIPKKRGNFIELRNGLINISPIGRSCTQEEREEYYEFDLKENIRENMIKKIKLLLGNEEDNINFSIGGQISIDIFPKGWDKTYCLQFVENNYDEIYFFGDKTDKGGNDYEIYNDSRVKAYSVKNYNETIDFLYTLFIN